MLLTSYILAEVLVGFGLRLLTKDTYILFYETSCDKIIKLWATALEKKSPFARISFALSNDSARVRHEIAYKSCKKNYWSHQEIKHNGLPHASVFLWHYMYTYIAARAR